MNEGSKAPYKGQRSRHWTLVTLSLAWVLLAPLIFGIVMALRSELHSIWLRALVAVAAFLVLYPAYKTLRTLRRK